MNENRKIPWLNLWMIVFGAAGLWLVIRDIIIFTPRDLETWIRLVPVALLPFLTAVVGIARWSSGLADLAGLYLTAWHTLWRNRGVLFVFGFIALINAVGVLVDSIIRTMTLPSMPGQLSHTWIKPWDFSIFSAKYGLMNWLLSSLENSLRSFSSRLLDWMVPGSGLLASSFAGVVFALVVLISFVWVRKRLKELSSDEEYASDARFVQGLILPLAIISAAVLVGHPIYLYKMLLFIRQSNSTAFGGPYRQTVAEILLPIIYTLVFSVMANGTLIGGLAGSLNRGKQNQPVTRDTFIRDAVQYFKPLAGIYLIIGLGTTVIYILPYRGSVLISSLTTTIRYVWMLALLLLMFAPYIPVVWGDGSLAAIRRSIRDWISIWKDVLSFIAVGFSLLVLPYVLLHILPQFVGPTSWLGIILNAPVAVLRTIFVAISAVAVWEFYNLISSTKADDNSA